MMVNMVLVSGIRHVHGAGDVWAPESTSGRRRTMHQGNFQFLYVLYVFSLLQKKNSQVYI